MLITAECQDLISASQPFPLRKSGGCRVSVYYLALVNLKGGLSPLVHTAARSDLLDIRVHSQQRLHRKEEGSVSYLQVHDSRTTKWIAVILELQTWVFAGPFSPSAHNFPGRYSFIP